MSRARHSPNIQQSILDSTLPPTYPERAPSTNPYARLDSFTRFD
jgi:hypothetical protein